jgi:transaldolase
VLFSVLTEQPDVWYYRSRSNPTGGAMSSLANFKVKIFADGADYDGIVKMSRNPLIKVFTTNPTLMRKAGVSDYEDFARKVLGTITDRPVSFEVFSDDFAAMAEQARTIATWGPNVNVKIPITNTKGQSATELIRALSSEGIVLNITALFTLDQVRAVSNSLDPNTPAIVSVFAGRIADAGVDPVPHLLACKKILSAHSKAELLWASTRELLNIYHAETSGCDIITVPNELLGKLDLIGKDLAEFSRETVQMFYRDAAAAAYQIKTTSFAAE